MSTLALVTLLYGAVKLARPNEGKSDGSGSFGIGNLDINNIPNMTKQDIIKCIPDDWTYSEYNGFVHIKDPNEKIRIRIDPPDKVT